MPVLLAAVLASVVVGGCGWPDTEVAGSDTSSQSGEREEGESAAGRAYYDLHGSTPEGMLTDSGTALAAAADRISDEVQPGVPVVLPDWLPEGMEVAAPFRGTGSGAALPNPHTWGEGWALTFTDGRTRITLVVDAAGEFSGEWATLRPAESSYGGDPLEVQRRPSVTLIRFAYADRSVVLIGERVSEEDLVRVAVSVRPFPAGD